MAVSYTHLHLIMFGDKVNARIQAKKADIPMIPGSDGPVTTYEEVKAFADVYKRQMKWLSL